MQKNISKVFAIFLMCAIMIAFASPGATQVRAAAPLLEENFNYGGTAGNLTATTANWLAHSAGGTNPIQYDTSSLTMPSYVSSGIGGYALFTTSGEDGNRTFASQSSGPLYLAALVNLTAGQTTGDYFLHFKTSSTGFAGRVFARNSGGNLQFGIGTTSTPVWSTTNYSFGTTYLVVAKHNMTTGASDLYVLTSCVGTEPSPLVSATGTAVTPLVGVAIRQGNSANAPNGYIDGIRVATNWADAVTCVSATPDLTISDVSQNEGDAGTTTFNFTVSLSAPAPVGGVTFDITTADNSATDANNDYEINTLTGQTITAGNNSYNFAVNVNGDASVEPNETFFVNVTNVVGTGVIVSDSQGLGTITNDDIAVTYIHDIQGSESAVTGAGPFTVNAIVVGDYQTQGSGQLKGFFIQEENADADLNPATSEGIFVYCNTCPDAVNVGDKVQVTGTASEYFNMSQLSATTLGSVVVQTTGNLLPTAASLTLPVPGVPTGDLAVATAFINAYYESFEGMLVTFPDTLYVTEYFELSRYGQVELSAGGRPSTFTAVNPPTELGFTNHQINLLGRMIILDDTDDRENRPVDAPNTAYFYPIPGLSTSNYFRGGDTIANLTGVLHWSFAGGSSPDAWRIRPVTEAFSYAFTAANPRPSMPTVNGRLKVASFNVLNYFLTIDTTAGGSGPCGPSLTLDCRGADNAIELSRQRTKMLAALSAIDADVFGFMELENTTGVDPLADIVAGLNALVGPGTYDYINTGVIGNDAIRVAIIYKTATVVPVGSYAILDSGVNPLFDDSRNRPALAQTFEEIASGERFTVVVNHLKSKGSSCGVGDDDTKTGQGNCNLTRTNAATALANWLTTDPTGAGDSDYLIIGDLNSYAMEGPITALVGAGYTNLVSLFGGPTAYGYVFDGQLGYLDHALSNPSLTPQVAGVAEWHINADENPLFDYNDDVKDTGEVAFEEESDVTTLYNAGPYRTSDHDPVIIGLNLSTTVTFNGNSATGGSMSPQTASGSNPLTLNAFTRTGYTFAGWSTTPNGAVAYADGATYSFAADITLYAQWVALPAPFNKNFPMNWTYGHSPSLILTWEASAGAVEYEYCVSATYGSCSTSWVSTSGATSASPVGLALYTTYFWQVRAKNSAGDFTYSGNWWAFVTQPSAFNKSAPVNGATGVSSTPSIIWEASGGATNYEYCVSTTNGVCGSWISTSGATSASLSLALNTTYYWQVRAISNGAYTYANGGNWFFFSTQSGYFNKTAPRNWTYGHSATPALTWDPSSSAVDYEYCVSAVNGTCSTSWVSTGGANTANPAGLSLYTTYYWQVRAVSAGGAYTYTGGWWAFVTQPAPFNKSTPRNWNFGNSASPTLIWGPSAGATDYEYCVSAVYGSCSTSWVSTSGATSANPAGLALNSTYYWQVRALANGAYTYSGNWWAFVTEPGAFNKSSPRNWSYGNLPTLTLTWDASLGATDYEYCVSMVSGSCSTSWISTSGATSANPAGLLDNTTYYWQVRAVANGAYKYTSWWAFVTQPAPFNKASPLNWSSGHSLTPTLSWGVSTGASGYEYCISTTVAGCVTWIPVGNVTSILISTPLLPNTTYYWQVRAVNGTTFVLANGSGVWAFTTAP